MILFLRGSDRGLKQMGVTINQAVIIAGGLGTRLKPFTETNPKPMYPFEGRPFIEHLVRQIGSFGISDILILLGYLPEKIMEYLGDGSNYGVHIEYDITPVEYETGQRIRAALPKLQSRFLFMYCDNYCPINYEKLLHEYEEHQSWIHLTVYANRDGYTKDNLRIAEDGRLLLYDKKRLSDNLQGVDIGYAIIDKQAVELLPEEPLNFEAYIYPKLIEQQKIYATVCEHRYYSVGSWERINLTKDFFKGKKAVFLDRDGTLNVRPQKACYVEKPEDFHWLNGAKEAIKKLNENDYFVILISNQPGIARGNLTDDMLSLIHKKMEDDLQKMGAKLDAIYYCPHNWDDGCFCRKPNPGMLFQAQRDFSLDLRNCVLVGDDERDIEAATRANVKGILVDEQYTILDAVNDIIGG